jgi:hypothetical protein
MKTKALFSARVIETALQGSAAAIPPEHLAIIQNWQAKTEFKSSETNLDGSFITGFLCPLLGYEEANKTGAWTIQKNTAIPGGGNVDVGIGHFDQAGKAQIFAPFELKGPKTKDLDALMAGRAKSPVQQAWEYATFIKGAQWVLVSNMVETRLYAVGYGRQAYETFQLRDLDKPAAYARFRLLLGKAGLLDGGTAALLARSEAADKAITDKLYGEYKRLRFSLITGLQTHNPTLTIDQALEFAQTILDRVLFIAFAEDTSLLPRNSLTEAHAAQSDYDTSTAWQRFKTLFSWVDKGMPKRRIPPYNGGLFRENPELDALVVPDELCATFAVLGTYDFASEVTVNILGHIFEQSVSDLEELKATLAGAAFDAKKSKKKKDGVVYTRDFITRYIVEQAVGGWLADKRRELGFDKLPVLDPEKDYPTLTMKRGKNATATVTLNAKAKQHLAFWQAYAAALASIKVLDPACGSGAFLVQVFDYLREEGLRVNAELGRLQGGIVDLLERLDTSILKNNLYGVDLNSEPVEITKLSLWLKTANSGEKLTYLDDNIKCGNSVVDDATVSPVAFDWAAQFPAIMAAGGFDVVVGNPPYVRMEVLKPIKPYLEKHFATATDRADLFVYFYELGLRLLKPQGWLGYISSSTFMKTGSGSKLRGLLASQATLQRLVDFGDIQVFEGVTTYPVIMVLQKGAPPAAHAIPFTVVDGASKVNFGTLEEQAPTYPQASLGVGSWQLEGDARAAVRRKIIGSHPTLKEVYGPPLYGIKTGLNEAFVIDQATRDRLVKEDPKAASIIKPFLEGKDLQKWHATPRQLHIIYIPRDHLDIQQYPSIKAYLLPFTAALESRATPQAWYELQQAQQSYEKYYSGRKIIYPEFSQGAKFSFDIKGYYFNNKVFFVPTDDLYLLGLLNSKVVWFFLEGVSAAMRGGEWRLELRQQYVETIPVPSASPVQKDALAALAEQCQTAAESRYKAEQEVVRRIPDLAPSPATAKLTKKLHAWHELDFAGFAKEVEKTFKQPIPLKERNDWQAFLAEHRAIIEARSAEVAQLEAEINQSVYKLFHLTDDEVRLIENRIV